MMNITGELGTTTQVGLISGRNLKGVNKLENIVTNVALTTSNAVTLANSSIPVSCTNCFTTGAAVNGTVSDPVLIDEFVAEHWSDGITMDTDTSSEIVVE